MERNQVLTQIANASEFVSKNKKKQALDIFDQLSTLTAFDNDPQVLEGLGVLACNLEQLPLAIQYLSKLVVLVPGDVTHLDQLAVAYISSNRHAEAYQLLTRALDINPDFANSLINLGCLYVHSHQFSKAVDVLERAQRHRPNDPVLLINLSSAYNYTGNAENALKCIQRAARNTDIADYIYYKLGSLNLELGKTDEAIKNYKKSIQINKHFGPCYWGIASAKKTAESDLLFIERAEEVLKESMSPLNRGHIHFALGKMYDDLKQWDKAFEHFKIGNLLKKQAYHIPPPVKFVKKIQKVCTPKLKDISTVFGSASEVPVFIFGMPRSGSTLTEQIISSHPLAATAGETDLFNALTMQIFSTAHKPLTEINKELSKDFLEKYAKDHLNFLMSNDRHNAHRIINKSPSNFNYIGFILMMFPNARLIHTVRHPLDTLLSCYFQPFNHIPWAQDMRWLAESYRHYRNCMQYWKSVLPEGRILDVYYEELIADPETQSRRIMDACGLEWHEDCLRFFQKDTSVRTASMWQVRQPIYHSSKLRWKNYAEHLEELARGVRPYLTSEDLDCFNQYGIKIRPIGKFESLLMQVLK